VDRDLVEETIPAGVVEVVVRIDHQERLVGELLCNRPDVRDPEAGIEEAGGFLPLHEKRVHMAGLAHQVNAWLELAHVEPRRAGEGFAPMSRLESILSCLSHC
jgi:hypothetical protein